MENPLGGPSSLIPCGSFIALPGFAYEEYKYKKVKVSLNYLTIPPTAGYLARTHGHTLQVTMPCMTPSLSHPHATIATADCPLHPKSYKTSPTASNWHQFQLVPHQDNSNSSSCSSSLGQAPLVSLLAIGC